MTIKLLKSLLIAALLASAAHAAEQQPIVIAQQEGEQTATFSVGDSHCVLKNDQIRCAPANSK
jgi:hypothetical protein